MARFPQTTSAHVYEDVFEDSADEDEQAQAHNPGYSPVILDWIDRFWEEDFDSPNPAHDQAIAFSAALTAQSTTGANFFRAREPEISPREIGLKDKQAVEHAQRYDPLALEARIRGVEIERRRVENSKPVVMKEEQPVRQKPAANAPAKVHEAITLAASRFCEDSEDAIRMLNTLAMQRPDLKLECALEKERWAARRSVAKRRAEKEEKGEVIPNSSIEGPKIMVYCQYIGISTRLVFLIILLFVSGGQANLDTIISSPLGVIVGCIFLGNSVAFNAITAAFVPGSGSGSQRRYVFQGSRTLPEHAFALPTWLGWAANIIGLEYTVFTTVLFVFPP
ncbi:uncharacterized protein MYCFIDRAFT_78977 [Pseudocercospora fijiensis CIRAD86]|uniref:Uncharacterized protein n=1 Tax=Pseudocercospora fijiensis (strain CIRAD86) TaxID=383855 RepID=M3AAC5_PSEFD|nr:uncharacterized protein MYCFIDRAFT_78977 [Pseudocercospora fijiensis CIRAD86]EME81561.1 hypothetical protein MYCFIDRAFT_78977 [Pseudocercospora fijiensis CIRAD86]